MTERVMTITVKIPDEHAEEAIKAVGDMINHLSPYGGDVDAHFEGAWDWDAVPR